MGFSRARALVATERAQRVTIATDWTIWVDHLPLLVAERLPLAQDAGLKLALFEPLDSQDTVEAVAVGHLDCGVVIADQLVSAVARGLPVCSVGTLVDSRTGMLTLARSGVAGLDDLRTARIGYQHAPRPWTSALLRSVLGDGIDEVDTQYEPVLGLLEDRCDAVWDIFESGDLVNPLFDDVGAGFVPAEALGLPQTGFLVLVANRTTLTPARIGTLARLRRLLREAIAQVIADPEAALDTIVAVRPWYDRERLRRSLAATIPRFCRELELVPLERWAVIGERLAELGVLAFAPDPERFQPDRFAMRQLGLDEGVRVSDL